MAMMSHSPGPQRLRLGSALTRFAAGVAARVAESNRKNQQLNQKFMMLSVRLKTSGISGISCDSKEVI
jgi:hypothetical protein